MAERLDQAKKGGEPPGGSHATVKLGEGNGNAKKGGCSC